MRTLRLAGIQVESRNFDVEGNLRRAEALVAVAAERGAELVLCPEFLATGYLYHPSIWDSLSRTAARRNAGWLPWLVGTGSTSGPRT
jgi:N-carbamoylputrescine amidase